MPVELYDHQKKALVNIKNGCILCGGVGSGKSITSLAYYAEQEIGSLRDGFQTLVEYSKTATPKDLYIITTARKRDNLEWEAELGNFLLSVHDEINAFSNHVTIDSWNNITKYKDVKSAFFIFDEQRVVGSGVWVKSFIQIAKRNKWILLSATPGDTWTDYIPVFVANGFYKNKTEFCREHIVYSRFSKFPKIDRYINIKRLERLRASILISMDFKRNTIPHHSDVFVNYDILKYKELLKKRWNPWTEKPIKNASELCSGMRRIVNEDESRAIAILEIFEKHPKIIIFYNFNYELDILKNLYYGEDVEVAEWNGHKHQEIPDSEHWVYLVQYTAGAEGWNCIKTDTIIFYSQNYSYKVMEQASGRIDRLNTLYVDLYYYHLKTRSGIDLAIGRALSEKKNFSEGRYLKKRGLL